MNIFTSHYGSKQCGYRMIKLLKCYVTTYKESFCLTKIYSVIVCITQIQRAVCNRFWNGKWSRNRPFPEKCPILPLPFRIKTFLSLTPFMFSLHRGNMNNNWYNMKPFIITITMKNKTDRYKIKFLNSALKHNTITNTNKNAKPCKLELWNRTWLVSEGVISGIFTIFGLNSSEIHLNE